jgi:hypothetical protein
MSDAVDSLEKETADFMDNMDESSTTDMLKLQQYMQKWTLATNLTTNLMNTLKEATKAVVSNIR